jgi:hypothetical protein
MDEVVVSFAKHPIDSGNQEEVAIDLLQREPGTDAAYAGDRPDSMERDSLRGNVMPLVIDEEIDVIPSFAERLHEKAHCNRSAAFLKVRLGSYDQYSHLSRGSLL